MKKILLTLVIIVGIIFAYNYFNLGQYLNLGFIQENREILLEKVSEHYIISVVVFIIFYALLTALSVPAASLITLLGGFIFGFLEGGVYVVVGATLGAVGVFLLTKYIFNSTFRKLISEKRIDRIEKEVDENGINYLLFLRFVPIFPFWVINIVPAFLGVTLFSFTWTTFIGIIPGTLAYTYAGQQLGTLEKVSDILSPGFISALVVIGIFSLIPVSIKKIKSYF